jgi:hypothetical protein
MTTLVSYCSGAAAAALLGVAALMQSSPAMAACAGPGAPTTGHTRCVAAILIPGNPLQSFDISSVNPDRGEYYFSDRANSGIDVIDTRTLKFKRILGGFVGVTFNSTHTAVVTSLSGPDGNAFHGRWLYGGDGNSTLKVFDLEAPTATALKQTISTGGSFRVDEMSLTTDGKLLLAVNNADDPPFATLFAANGDAAISNVTIINTVSIDTSIIPKGFGLGFEASIWDPVTQRFYASLPTIANNPPGCNYGQLPGGVPCGGGLVVIDPTSLATPAVIGAFNSTTNVGVIPLDNCGPNGITLDSHGNLLEGCDPGNDPSNTGTVVINAKTKNYATVANITGSDEVWFNQGDNRYYLAASDAINPTGSPLGSGAVLGIVNDSSVLVQTIPQSSDSHSVAADSTRNLIFVPQVATTGVINGDSNTTAGAGSTTVGQLLCGSSGGCIVVYKHDTEDDDDDDDNR